MGTARLCVYLSLCTCVCVSRYAVCHLSRQAGSADGTQVHSGQGNCTSGPGHADTDADAGRSDPFSVSMSPLTLAKEENARLQSECAVRGSTRASTHTRVSHTHPLIAHSTHNCATAVHAQAQSLLQSACVCVWLWWACALRHVRACVFVCCSCVRAHVCMSTCVHVCVHSRSLCKSSVRCCVASTPT